jgi:hypothetical protein
MSIPLHFLLPWMHLRRRTYRPFASNFASRPSRRSVPKVTMRARPQSRRPHSGRGAGNETHACLMLPRSQDRLHLPLLDREEMMWTERLQLVPIEGKPRNFRLRQEGIARQPAESRIAGPS